MKNKTKQQEWSSLTRQRLATLFSGGVAICYALFVFLPSQRATDQIWRDIKSKNQQIADAAQLAQPMRELRQKLADTEAFIQQWRTNSPRSATVSPVYGSIIQFARESNTELLNFTPQVETALANISMIPVSIQTRGSYHNVHEFLHRLESLPASVWVDELELKRRDSNDSDLECSFRITIFADRSEISG